MKKLYGVITAMTTPFTADGKVDTAALEEQTEYLIEKGIQCLYPCGTTGEMYLMSAEERELVAETVVKKAAGRVTVFIHVGAMTVDETIRLAQHAHKIGADGVGVVTPSYFTVNDRAMVEYYKTVCAALPDDFPVYVYVIPQLAHNDISAATMEQIAAACKNVVGVKYSFADMRRINEYLQVRRKLLCGARRGRPVPACPGVRLRRCCLRLLRPIPRSLCSGLQGIPERRSGGSRKAQVAATELVKLMQFGGDMSIFKNILTFRGVTGGHMRKPLLDLTDEQVAQLKQQVAPYI